MQLKNGRFSLLSFNRWGNRLAAERISSSGEIVRKQILMPIAEEAYQQQLIEIVKSIT